MLRKYKTQLIYELIIRISVATFLILGIINPLPYRFFFLIIAGIILGSYYGWNNDVIWTPTKDLKLHPIYRGHQLWIHVFCGVIGSLALCLLLNKVNSLHFTSNNLNGVDIFLFVVSALGYTGLLPRTLWFFVNRGGNFETKV